MESKVGINGFGRIGKLFFRSVFENNYKININSINDPFATIEQILYQLKFDSTHGKFNAEIKQISDSEIQINGKNIKVTNYKNPCDIPWKANNVDIVVECSGVFLTQELAGQHLKGGAQKVIMSAPAKDDTKTFVYGVNHMQYNNEQIISNASCTTNCLAPIVQILENEFGIESGLMTTCHSATQNQLVVDGYSRGGKDWRAGRAASQNIIPSSTGAAKAVGLVIPKVQGKLTGMAMRVPTLNVSCIDLTVNLAKETTYEEICKKIKEYSQNQMKGILGYTDEQVVSSDFIHDSHSSIFDEKAGIMLNSKFVKLISWYDNEWGYSTRLADMVQHINK